MFQKIKKLYISKNKNITKKSHWKKGEQLTVTLNAASVEAIREEGEEVKAEKWQNNINDNYKTTTSIKIEETTRRQEFNYLNKGSSSISSSIGSNRERVVYQSCSCNISSNRNQDIKGERRPEVIEIFRFGQKMANTISVMTNVLRNAVSKQRIRYKEKGFNLDLAYICDNIIAMGYPADNLEKIYRNPLEDVYKFLEENHRDRYKIYNLCLERSYDVNKFHGRVSVYPFEDHNPPTIELIQRFCADVDEWLKADTNNVAAVHCKAGKGRTGTMICCYLIYSNQQQTAEDALAYYDEKRTKDRKGVTIPSQRRYVQYFAKLLRSNLHYTRRSLEFFEIRFTEAHALYSQGTVNCSISALEDSCGCFKVQTLRNLNIDFRKSFTLDMKNFALRVAGDIKIELTQKTSKKKILHFWFNTYFVYDSAMLEGEGENAKLVYTLNKWEIDDAHKDKEHKMFSDDFKVQLAFYNESNDSTDLNRPNDNHHLHRTYPATTPNLPVLRGTVPVPVTMTTTVTTKPCESSNSSNSEMQIICDEQATGIGLGGGGGTYENLLDTKPYGNHHQDTNTNTTTTILTDRRPTSMITLNDTNSSPHKLIQQQQQHHRRSVTNTTTTTSGNHQRQLLQIQHKINTCNSNNHQQQQQQHNNHIQMGKTTTMRNINNQSNMSNSSNSSINSHITSVSSSASMASTSGGIISGGKQQQQQHQQQQQQQLFINDFNEKHEEELDNEDDIDDDDEDEDNDVDDDEEDDDADREDNEEDWESGESAVNKPLPTTTTTTITTTITTTTTTTISPIRFNEKQLVTNNRTTNSTTNYTTLSTTTTTTTIPKTTTKNAKCLNIKEKQLKQQKQQEDEEEQHQRQMKKNSSGSSTSSSNYFNEIGDIVHFYNDNGNKVHIDNNYIDDVDDDDDDDENDNDDDDDNMLNTTTAATTNNYANNNIQCAVNPTTTTTTTTTFENDDSKSAKCTNNNINNNNNNKQLMSNLVARYKFMHLLTAKASNKVMAPRHSYFKRKSLKTKSTTTTTTCTTEAAAASSIATETTKNINCLTNDCYMLAGAAGGNDCVDGVEELRTRTTSVGNSGGCAGGVGGGLAKASKLKLKLGLSKTNSKLKWTQKFHWLQNYVRSADAAADLRKSFAQTTTTTTTSSSQRLNSNSSGNATITTTTTNTTNCNGIKNSTPSQIVVGSSCTEDYYSSICDNQLSFNNSPCKSPRSQKQKHATHAATTAAAATGGSSIQSPTSLLVNDDVGLKVVVVAARPANIEAIGFNVASTTDTTTTTNISSMAGATAAVALGTCNITNGSGSNSSSGYATASTLHSDSSIYSTPPTSVLEQQTTIVGVVEHTHHHEKISPFIFPNISAEITELAHVLKSSNIDTKTTETTTTTTTNTTTTIKNGSIKHNIDNDNDDEFDEHNNKQA